TSVAAPFGGVLGVGKFEHRRWHVSVLERKGAERRQRLLPFHHQPVEVLLLFFVEALTVGLNNPLVLQFALGLKLGRERSRRLRRLTGGGCWLGRGLLRQQRGGKGHRGCCCEGSAAGKLAAGESIV